MAPGASRRALLLFAVLAASFPVFAQQTDAQSAVRRRQMVNEQIAARDVKDPRVLDAMRKVPRHRFVPPALISRAYDDSPLPIGYSQTISQPFIVAHMTEALDIQSSHKVLEIGTGSGYQAAVLGELARTVYTIEIVPELARSAAATLKALGYSNVHVRAGDGYAGWPEHAPFDRIMLTAAPEEIPKPLIDQLAPRGRLLAPVGEQGAVQWLTIVDKTPQGVTQRRTLPVRFVPFTRSR
ncbi:MAG TPA: protein-L-isoaspartate(D-aspartate) O-methyltransferase [Vicinamibacterales bacterium]|nr:protein-L-isoaspartate(D-aspartate) O-methyltransferase [Vicinamibacterales bacterium]